MSKNVIYAANAPEPIGPYSQAIQSGNMLFISGQVAIQKPSGNLITGNIQDETHQVMKNLGEILKAAGMEFDLLKRQRRLQLYLFLHHRPVRGEDFHHFPLFSFATFMALK